MGVPLRNYRLLPSLLTSAMLLGEARADPSAAPVAAPNMQTRDGKMVIDEHRLCRVDAPGAKTTYFQVAFHVEAPLDAGLSETAFLAFGGGLVRRFGTGSPTPGDVAAGARPPPAAICGELASPVGMPDYTNLVFMSANGVATVIVKGESEVLDATFASWDELRAQLNTAPRSLGN